MAIVTSPVVNMYANPNLFSETVSQAKMGDDVEILEDTDQSFFLVKKSVGRLHGIRREKVR